MSGLRRQIVARIWRLEELEHGLAKEETTQRDRLWLAMLAGEQREYGMAIRQARQAIGQARAALEKAAQKLQGYPLV